MGPLQPPSAETSVGPATEPAPSATPPAPDGPAEGSAPLHGPLTEDAWRDDEPGAPPPDAADGFSQAHGVSGAISPAAQTAMPAASSRPGAMVAALTGRASPPYDSGELLELAEAADRKAAGEPTGAAQQRYSALGDRLANLANVLTPEEELDPEALDRLLSEPPAELVATLEAAQRLVNTQWQGLVRTAEVEGGTRLYDYFTGSGRMNPEGLSDAGLRAAGSMFLTVEDITSGALTPRHFVAAGPHGTQPSWADVTPESVLQFSQARLDGEHDGFGGQGWDPRISEDFRAETFPRMAGSAFWAEAGMRWTDGSPVTTADSGGLNRLVRSLGSLLTPVRLAGTLNATIGSSAMIDDSLTKYGALPAERQADMHGLRLASAMFRGELPSATYLRRGYPASPVLAVDGIARAAGIPPFTALHAGYVAPGADDEALHEAMEAASRDIEGVGFDGLFPMGEPIAVVGQDGEPELMQPVLFVQSASAEQVLESGRQSFIGARTLGEDLGAIERRDGGYVFTEGWSYERLHAAIEGARAHLRAPDLDDSSADVRVLLESPALEARALNLLEVGPELLGEVEFLTERGRVESSEEWARWARRARYTPEFLGQLLAAFYTGGTLAAGTELVAGRALGGMLARAGVEGTRAGVVSGVGANAISSVAMGAGYNYVAGREMSLENIAIASAMFFTLSQSSRIIMNRAQASGMGGGSVFATTVGGVALSGGAVVSVAELMLEPDGITSEQLRELPAEVAWNSAETAMLLGGAVAWMSTFPRASWWLLASGRGRRPMRRFEQVTTRLDEMTEHMGNAGRYGDAIRLGRGSSADRDGFFEAVRGAQRARDAARAALPGRTEMDTLRTQLTHLTPGTAEHAARMRAEEALARLQRFRTEAPERMPLNVFPGSARAAIQRLHRRDELPEDLLYLVR